MMKKLVLGWFLVALTACGTQNVDISTTASIPNKPLYSETTVRGYLKDLLKDPDSMKAFEISEPRLGKYYGGMFNGFKTVPSWYVCYGYNAKNSYGGYAGFKSYVAFFEGEMIIPAPNNHGPPVQDGYREFSC
tara:strand:- start:2710 stop:3108 length:399 start_codon:yes stop_codon:yes gene_type:complete